MDIHCRNSTLFEFIRKTCDLKFGSKLKFEYKNLNRSVNSSSDEYLKTGFNATSIVDRQRTGG